MENLSQEQLQEIIDNIEMRKVFSSNVVAIGYNATNQLLKVIFKPNSAYIYFNVGPEIWTGLNNTTSVGKLLGESVIRQKDKYKFMKL